MNWRSWRYQKPYGACSVRRRSDVVNIIQGKKGNRHPEIRRAQIVPTYLEHALTHHAHWPQFHLSQGPMMLQKRKGKKKKKSKSKNKRQQQISCTPPPPPRGKKPDLTPIRPLHHHPHLLPRPILPSIHLFSQTCCCCTRFPFDHHPIALERGGRRRKTRPYPLRTSTLLY
jgi:hypothetical protein